MRSERGLDRFVTFLDAVVAIAITLLVLPLAEVLQDVEPGRSLGSVLSDEGGQFFAFFLSFAVIARFWMVHHRVVEGVGAYDSAFLLLNLLWMLTIVLLPFATQVVGSYPPEPLAVGIYIGTITASSASLAAVTILVWRRPALRRDADEPAPTPWPSLVTTGILVVALLLGTLVRQVNYGAMLLLLLTGPLEGWLRRRERAR
ncbi:TMEM175 family protein [Petropleomorpha daqingensis]|uniref:Putative membrane protein n=1 Tax=Petropleomorpha daqingensis TaxID=2026353 RepID=A0A853C8E9_9ACTN|nr:putative membrane protein [Petropleomorpha daqingensis]